MKVKDCTECKHFTYDCIAWCIPRSIAHPDKKGAWAFCEYADKKPVKNDITAPGALDRCEGCGYCNCGCKCKEESE